MKHKILIVDDELVARESLKKLLSPYGNCDAVDNGEKALEVIRAAQETSEPYTLMTLDVDMPGIDGMEVLKAVRKLESMAVFPKKNKMKIIMISATEDVESNTLNSYFLDSEYYIVKPATPEKLSTCFKVMKLDP